MNLFRLYGRVLVLLGPEARLGWFLAVANLALSAAMFAEPVLFGRIIDALAGSQKAGAEPLTFYALLPLLKEYSSYKDIGDTPSDLHAALSLVLGWLLVFRTNAAYARWWEARTLWGSLINCSRNLAI